MTPEEERAAVVRWLRGDGGKIPGLSAFARLVSGNNMPAMSGDDRDRLRASERREFDATINHICAAIEAGVHLSYGEPG